jgi:hypothetical protein
MAVVIVSIPWSQSRRRLVVCLPVGSIITRSKVAPGDFRGTCWPRAAVRDIGVRDCIRLESFVEAEDEANDLNLG